MIPRSLTGRLAVAFAALALAVLVGVGGALVLVLRGLHADATQSSLADLADSLLPQLRASVVAGDLRGTIADVQDRLSSRGISVLIDGADGVMRSLDGSLTGHAAIDLPASAARGETTHGLVVLDDRQRYAYAATVLRTATAPTGARAIVLVTPDRSGAEAIGDLWRTIPAVLVVLLVVGASLAILLSRSVTGPLRRLAAAAAALPAGRASPVPVEGPTEVRELTARFNAMSSELAAGRAREAELLANLRHDLRTPLTVISGFATALADGVATGDDASRASRAIVEEADRLERLVDELGAIEALGSGAASLRPESLDVGALLEATVERFISRATSLGVTLSVARPEATRGLTFAADRQSIERILGNLVGNALAAVSPGGHIWLEAQGVASPQATNAPGGAAVARVALAVTDDGPGFPPGTSDRVFERFFRADPSRSGEGSGLGLAIVQQLAVAHGGFAHAENVAPHGARVSVVLPIVPHPGGAPAADVGRA